VSELPGPARTQAPERASDRVLCVLCRAGTERLAVQARDVHKVVERARITRMPRLPAAFVGITHHRGRIVTVIDAVALLRLQPGDRKVQDVRVLVLERGQRHLGLMVDAVDEVEPMRLGADLPFLDGPGGPNKALRIAQHQGKAVLAVDADRLVELIGAVADT
jgi:chemotaxis signal transduction protein